MLEQLPPYFKVPAGMAVSSAQGKRLTLAGTAPSEALYSAGVFAAHLLRKTFRPGDVTITMGQALIAYLRKALQDYGIPLWLNSPAEELVVEGDRVMGVVVQRSTGERVRVGARRGVVLAAGGFARNPDMRSTHQPATNGGIWTAANPADAGDAIAMSEKHGAATGLMDDAWWVPMLCPPDEPPYLPVFERAKPGYVMVNSQGSRFVNEAAPYQHVGAAMLANDSAAASTVPSWFVLDSRYLRRYPFGPIMPRTSVKKYVANGFLIAAGSIGELATKLEIDPVRLTATIDVHNDYARTGHDPEFSRGASAFDRCYADPRVHPNPCLAPIEVAPFYAAQVWPGDIGTKGGLVIDPDARVLDESDQPVPGLCAVGNSTSSIMGHAYPGPGATIGPSMVMGYIAGLHAAGRL